MGRGHHFPGTGGKITAINSNSITIEQRDGKTAQVNITDKTKFRKERQDATLADFKVGDEIMVRGASSAEGVWQAEMVGSRPRGGFGGGGNFRDSITAHNTYWNRGFAGLEKPLFAGVLEPREVLRLIAQQPRVGTAKDMRWP